MLTKTFLSLLLLQNLTLVVDSILGGKLVKGSQFPWIVEVIQCRENSDECSYCGGSIISKNVIMTAAHCVNMDNNHKTSVLMGNSDLASDQIRVIKVKSVLIHPNYDPKADTFPNDIALLQLTEDLIFDEHIKAINLTENFVDEENLSIFVAGWGQAIDEIPKEITYDIKLDKFKPKILRMKKLQLVNMKTCKDMFATINDDIEDSKICATSFIPNIPGTCHGDSGSPLMRFDEAKGQHEAIGIVSYRFQQNKFTECFGQFPAVYTRVSSYVPWIKKALTKWSISEKFEFGFYYLKNIFIAIIVTQIFVLLLVLLLFCVSNNTSYPKKSYIDFFEKEPLLI